MEYTICRRTMFFSQESNIREQFTSARYCSEILLPEFSPFVTGRVRDLK